jgi:hypothetical protein
MSAAPESTFLREAIVGAAPAASELVETALVVIAERGHHRYAPAALSSLRFPPHAPLLLRNTG